MTLSLSNTLSDGMVLQHDRVVVWGFGIPGSIVAVRMSGGGDSPSKSRSLQPATVGADGVWRATLPPQKPSLVPHTLHFDATNGGGARATISLRDVLFGNVLMCSGQSNMQHGLVVPYTLANASAEIADAHTYADQIRVFSAGMDASCIGPHTARTQCAQPWRMLSTRAPLADSPACTDLKGSSWRRASFGAPCRLPWSRATAHVLRHALFSAVCYLAGKRLAAADRRVPVGLISASWAATPMQLWQPLASRRECHAGARVGGVLFHSLIAPFTLGPMGLRGIGWYQGEENVGSAAYVACALPSMIRWWRTAFGQPKLWWGVVQIAGWRYSQADALTGGYEIEVSHAAADLRQAQLSVLRLRNVGVVTAIDTGHWLDIHPAEKSTVASRLAQQALAAGWIRTHGGTPGGSAAKRLDETAETVGEVAASMATDVPVFAGSTLLPPASWEADGLTRVRVRVDIRAARSGRSVALTGSAPPSATLPNVISDRRGHFPPWIPRNECVTSIRWGSAAAAASAGSGLRARKVAATAAFETSFVSDCGYSSIDGHGEGGEPISLNATADVGTDGSSIVLSAVAPAGFVPLATSMGRASWPMPRFYSVAGALPVLPWYAALNTTDPYTPPRGWAATEGVAVKVVGRGRSCAWVSDDHELPALAEFCRERTARSFCAVLKPSVPKQGVVASAHHGSAADNTGGAGAAHSPLVSPHVRPLAQPPWQAVCKAFPSLGCPSEAYGRGLPC